MTVPAAHPSATECYGPVARAVHWAVAVLAFVVVFLGWTILGAARESGSREWLMLLHRSVGLSILVLMVFRLGWRLRNPPPPLPAGFPPLEAFAAHADHVLLYLLFIVIPLSGYINAAAAGHAVSFFGLFSIPPLLPKSGWLSQIAIAVHLVGQFLIYALVGVHIAAALVHRFVHRNAILSRMLPPQRRAG